MRSEQPFAGRNGEIIAVDFNGVIHDHRDGQKGFCDADSPEIPGAIEWLKEISESFDVFLVSASFSRAPYILAAKQWLNAHGVPLAWMASVAIGRSRITLTPFKPCCTIFLDDRAMTFRGTFPTKEFIKGFRPWNR